MPNVYDRCHIRLRFPINQVGIPTSLDNTNVAFARKAAAPRIVANELGRFLDGPHHVARATGTSFI